MADHPPPGPIRHIMSLRARNQMDSPYARLSQDPPVRKPRAARKAKPKQPKSHYNKLSAEKKQAIRPFVFLELPAELRLEIYKRILLIPACFAEEHKPSASFFQPQLSVRSRHNLTQGRLIIRGGNFVMDPIHQRRVLQLQILQCCWQLCKEGRDYFWNQNRIEQHNDLDTRQGTGRHFNSTWPQHGMHLPSIRVLRVAFSCSDYINPSMRFSCSSIDSLPNLEVLQVGFMCDKLRPAGDWRSDGESKYWRESLILGAVVRRIVQHTPSTVTLRWGIWDEALEDRYIKLGASISIHGSILERVAKSYKRERGRKIRPAIKKESGD